MMSQLTRWGFSREAGRQHNPVPLVRRPVAYTGPYPIRSHRTMAQVMADEARADRPDWYSEFVSLAGGDHKADSASGLEGLAAEVTSGAPAGHGHTSNPANADQSRALFEPAAYPFPGDAEPAPSVAVPIAAADGAFPDDDEDPEPAEIRKPPKVDYARLAAAARARPLPVPVAAKAPSRHAPSPDPCQRCGVAGWRGCSHQLPYEDYRPAGARYDVSGRPGPKGRYPGMRPL